LTISTQSFEYFASVVFSLLIIFPGCSQYYQEPPYALSTTAYQMLPSVLAFDDSAVYTEVNGRKTNSTLGHTVKTELSITNSGEWRKYSHRYNTWLLKIDGGSATAIALVFSDVKLREGEKLYVYNSNDMRGPLDSSTIPASGILLTNYLPGHEIVVEFNVPITNQATGSFKVEAISRLNENGGSDLTRRNATACYPCMTGNFWNQAKESVLRIITFRNNETIMCTGSLVNNTSRDGRPYILTANHCIQDQEDADRAIFTFNYEDLNCDGTPENFGSSLIGGTLRASSYENDFSLIELNHHIPLGFQTWFAGWDATGATKDHVSCIHHPQAGVKRISVENESIHIGSYQVEGSGPRAENAFWQVKQWDVGITEGGSSGAPLFDQHHRVIGTLSGGASKCEYPYNDFFQRLSNSWDGDEPSTQLKYWLDPESSGEKVIDGYDPTDGMVVQCDTLTNVETKEITRSLRLKAGEGYVAGCNNQGITAYAEEFFSPDSALLEGTHLIIGTFDPEAAGGIIVSVDTEEHGKPGEQIMQKYIPYSQLQLFSNYVEFYPGIAVKGKFFISCSPDCSATDEFALEQAEWRASGLNSAWIKQSSQWLPMTAAHEEGFGSSLSIDAMLCTIKDRFAGQTSSLLINLYPNPSSSVLMGSVSNDSADLYRLAVFDMQGQSKTVDVAIYGNDFVMDVSALDAGVYVLSIYSGQGTLHRRFVKK
jgi:lysyl endopeptidase